MGIRFQAPQLPDVEAIQKYFGLSESARYYSNFGPCHQLLVARLQEYLGQGLACVPVANATLGLIVALRVLAGGSAKREVLVPSFTFAAVVEAVQWAGLEPVFVDIEPDAWHMDGVALKTALRDRSGTVAAVLAASTFGTPPLLAQRAEWEEAVAAAGVPLLVDSAAGFGATDEIGLRLGGQGTAEVFSFHATKPFAIGEGGLITTRDFDLAARFARATNFGFDEHVVEDTTGGINAKLAEWPAATALAVLDGFDEVIAARRANAEMMLATVSRHGYSRQVGSSGSVWQFVPVLAPTRKIRDEVLSRAAARGVELRSYFAVPLHRMGAFRGVPTTGALRVTDEIAGRILSLPMANDISGEARDAICECLS